MPIMREPKPLPSPLNYIPPDSDAYAVTARDSCDTLAQRPDLKTAGISSSDLCYFNFRTRVPAEINWYLFHKVGCRHPTQNHLNFVFSYADEPGIVYLPKFGSMLPAHEKVEDEKERTSAEQLVIYASEDSSFPRQAQRVVNENPGKNFAEEAASSDDIEAILDRYENLKQLNFYTHGNVGYLYFPKGGISKYNLETLAAPHDKLFAGEGRVLFLGCDIGDGKDGRNFLIAAGRRLLNKHGGFVGATNSVNFSDRFGFLDIFKPRWGDLIVIHLDADGNVLQEKK